MCLYVGVTVDADVAQTVVPCAKGQWLFGDSRLQLGPLGEPGICARGARFVDVPPASGSIVEASGKGPPMWPMAKEVPGRQGMECPKPWHIPLCLKVVLLTATQSWLCSEMSEGRAVPAAAFCPLPGCRKWKEH